MSNKPDGLEPRGNSDAFEFGRQWFEMSIKVQKAMMTLVDVPLRTGDMPAHLTQAASAAFGNMYLGLINDPASLARSQVEFWRRHAELWHNLLNSGDDNAEPTSGERRDRRFRNEEWEKNLRDAAIERVKRQVDPKHYQIFDLYVIKQWPVTTVARTLKISAGRVYLVKHRIGNLIKKELRHLRTKPI